MPLFKTDNTQDVSSILNFKYKPKYPGVGGMCVLNLVVDNKNPVRTQ